MFNEVQSLVRMQYTLHLSFIADDASSEAKANQSLFVACSAIDESSSVLLHRMAAAKANMSALREADGGAIATLSVYFLLILKTDTVLSETLMHGGMSPVSDTVRPSLT